MSTNKLENQQVNLRQVNQDLMEMFTNVVWVEEYELKQSPFAALTVKELHTIYVISMYDEKTASQVAKAVHLSPSAMTTAIDRLVDKGYVERRRSKEDRRVVKLGLTHQGRVLYRAHRQFHYKVTKALMEDMSTEEALAMERAVHNLQTYLKALLNS
ncbi:transcriptional regulator, MarR family [Fructobacillus pseudoficulneus]|uniref:Transcriptional regulator, MarR family n=1 Tax=Fructobacillus pseudoficulneus TaxID=220714 RepID=A0A3F3GWA3_9LACO|nr:MarR family transcriptional regulator [Fructobacillus pseudoficulneus]GAP03074.1 transcriptional regulator, MarR family [Fructobacillus pseudoficulneus]SEH41598.1 DNA-binding transcriptional regulator, MarR family [Fructobacillus pseudoficulneus]